MAPVWSPERRDALIRRVAELRASGAVSVWPQVAKEFDTTPDSARNAFRRMASSGAAPMRAPEPVDLVAAAQQRREQLQSARAERELIEAVAGEKSLRSTLEHIARDTARHFPPPPRYVPPKPPKGGTIESVVQEFSDFHGGEIVTFERTRGFNQYSTSILARRLKRVVDSHISIKGRMERGGGWRFQELVIALNGDLVSGSIHEIERHSDAKNVVMAVYAVAFILAQAIRELGAQYPAVRIFCTSGNHGRLPDARRVQGKDALRNWDAMIALLVRDSLRDMPHLTFEIPDSYAVAYDVQGWTFIQTHGHEVKSWNSIPWYGLNRLVGNLNALEASRQRTINYWLFAHFHNPSSLGHASGESFINGSMIGGTEFSINALGKADKPTQWMLMVHPEHGVTSRWPLNGDGPEDGAAYTVPAESLLAGGI